MSVTNCSIVNCQCLCCWDCPYRRRRYVGCSECGSPYGHYWWCSHYHYYFVPVQPIRPVPLPPIIREPVAKKRSDQDW